MKQHLILWPMLAHVALVFIVYVVLAIRRGGAVKSGEADVRQFKGRADEPASSVTAANNVMNQFELPVLFHTGCICFYVTNGVTMPALVLAWIFAGLRYPHAWVHLTSNKLRWRNSLFRLGVVTLLVLWIVFAYHLARMG